MGSLTHQAHVRLIPKDRGKPLVEQRMTVNAEDADPGQVHHFPKPRLPVLERLRLTLAQNES
jgi:hypothetical protein